MLAVVGMGSESVMLMVKIHNISTYMLCNIKKGLRDIDVVVGFHYLTLERREKKKNGVIKQH